jgi:hypothetical protein
MNKSYYRNKELVIVPFLYKQQKFVYTVKEPWSQMYEIIRILWTSKAYVPTEKKWVKIQVC